MFLRKADKASASDQLALLGCRTSVEEFRQDIGRILSTLCIRCKVSPSPRAPNFPALG